jgi:hypothetical protein
MDDGATAALGRRNLIRKMRKVRRQNGKAKFNHE